VKEFLAMGGYAAYVWTAYGLTAAVIGLNAWLAQRRYRQALQQIGRSGSTSRPHRRPTVRKLS
jgi:heme exporter protein D